MPKKQTTKRKETQTPNPRKSIAKLRKTKEKRAKRQKKIWTDDEDTQLLKLIHEYGAARWSTIANFMPGRQGKQCRERWHNHLNPEIRKCDWQEEEEWVLYLLHKLYGNKWAILAQMISGRTDNAIKNHWNSIMKRKVRVYEGRLKKTLEGFVVSENMDENTLEEKLLIRIAKGEFDNKSCRKGRKRNYSSFFEKNQLQDFVVKKPEPVHLPEKEVEENKANISIVYEISSPVAVHKISSYESLFDTKTPNNADDKENCDIRITSYNKDFDNFYCSVNGKNLYSNENLMLNKNSELSISKNSNIGFAYHTPSKRIFETSNAKYMGFRTPERPVNLFSSVNSLQKPWY